MKYMLLISGDPATYDPAQGEKITAEYMAFTRDIADSGELVAGEALQGTDTATTVRVRDGKRATTDGPFAETKEVLGGFYLIDVPNLDDALEFAAAVPAARMGGLVEVRPVVER